jgi:hypothetical protein
MAERQSLETTHEASIRKKVMLKKKVERQSLETPLEANTRRRSKAENKSIRKNLETLIESNIRRKKEADRMDKRKETPQQWIERYQEYNAKMKNWNSGINGNNGRIGISLEEEFVAEVKENVNVNNVPMITEKVEVEAPRSNAFQHIMKTKIGHDEIIPDNILDQIHWSLSTDENVKILRFLCMIR